MQAVLQATLEQLGRRGFPALSIEDVARAAGVNKTTIYRRWATKEELFIAAVVAVRDGGPRFVETGRLRDDLVALLRIKAQSVSTPLGREIAHALISLDPQANAALTNELRRRRFTLPRDFIERAIERGDLKPGADAGAITDLLLSPIYYRALVLREPVSDALLARTVDLVLAGVGARVPRRERGRRKGPKAKKQL